MNSTEEQTTILSAATTTDDNLLINALAGTGKTSTLEMIERAVKTRPILYMVFNSKNAEEARKRMLNTTTVRTFNAMGHRIWAQAQGHKNQLRVEPKKSQNIMREMISEIKDKGTIGAMWDSFWPVIHGVAMAKAVGYVPDGKFEHAKRLCTRTEFHAHLEEDPDDLTSDLIDAALTRSISEAYKGHIDYNDQIYMPALFGGTYPRPPLVLVDEGQDLSPTNHALLERVCRGRVIAVGDRWQNIYGFRGAKEGGMNALQARYKMKELDLSVSFRCPRAVVEAARWRVPKFKWIKDGGHVEHLRELPVSDVVDGAVFICRNNAPLFKLALRMLSAGRSISVSGSDVGPRIIAQLRKLGDESMPRAAVMEAITEWLAEKLDRQSTVAEDQAACMRVFATFGSNLGQAISYAEHLFAQKTGQVQFMTGHKSKGMEFETVYHLDPFLCREDEQDKNLSYVILTRSANTYFAIKSEDMKWD